MTSALFEVNKKYWTDRAPSYSQVNQEELAGCQRSNWLREISRQIQMVYPNRAPQEITVLDAGTGPGFFAVILAEASYTFSKRLAGSYRFSPDGRAEADVYRRIF